MPQITVYVSDELLKRMTAAKGELPGHSAVFAEAVQQRLDQIESKQQAAKGGDSMVTAIERLRAEKKMATNSALEDGFAAGKTFAQEEASYALLAQLEEARQLWALPGRHAMTDLLEAHDMAGKVTDLVRENGIVDDATASAFWDGFLQGALAVWRKVRAKI